MGGSAREPGRSHLIRRDEVATWLADSAVKQVTIHWTSEENARRIREEGVRIEQIDPEATWGHGFYTSTRPLPEFGDTGIRVAVRLQRPFIVEDRIAARELIDELRSGLGTEDIRATLQAAGHDGVLIHWESGEVWVVAYEDEQVRILQEGSSG
jgi:hypothetical protein